MPIKHADDHSITGRETQVKLLWLRPDSVIITCWVDAIDPYIAHVLRERDVALSIGGWLFCPGTPHPPINTKGISIVKALRLLVERLTSR